MSDIFISYASEDKEKAGLLAKVLEEQGWTVWWDKKIPPGKTFDEVISEALDAAKCVVVLWSIDSVKSDWVKEEAAVGANRKILIPALIDDVGIPLGFGRIQAAQLVGWQGIATDPNIKELIESIASLIGYPKVEKPKPDSKPLVNKHEKTKHPKIVTKVVEKRSGLHQYSDKKIKTEPIEQPSHKIKAEDEKKHKSKKQMDAVTKITATRKSKLPWLLPATIVPFIIGMVVLMSVKGRNTSEVVSQATNTVLSKNDVTENEEHETSFASKRIFRSKFKKNLSAKSVKSMLKDKGFYDSSLNKSAWGFPNNYILQKGGKVVFDNGCLLTWQRSGSENSMKYENAKSYIAQLNSNQFAGYNDWRLPTLEEAMSLMEPTVKNDNLYIDPVFDTIQRYIWTSDLKDASFAWAVNLYDGDCGVYSGSGGYVRAVR